MAPAAGPPETRAAARVRHLALFRQLTAASLHQPPDMVRLEHDDRGQPRVTEPSPHFLSAADRDGWTLTAIAGLPVGVDVEAAEPEAPLPIDLLHAAERRRLSSLAPADRTVAFARLWTAKEAYAKAFCRSIDEALALPSRAGASGLTIGGAAVAFHCFADRIAAAVVADRR